jgi:HSP20 family protein
MNRKDFSNQIKKMRQELDLTQKELAESLDISRQSLSNLEKGQFFPSFNLILELEDFFKMPIREIYNNKKGVTMDKNFSPFDELNRMREEFDQMFGGSLRSTTGSLPKVNVYQDEANLVIEVEVPGMSKDDLEINLTSDSASIKGEKKESQEIKEENYVRKESSFGSFNRQIHLPVKIDDSKAKATIKDGRVRIIVPIKERAKQSKGLEISEE